MPNTRTLRVRTIRDDPSEPMKVREELLALLRQSGVQEKLASALVLAVDEALTALINYHRETGSRREFTLGLDLDAARFKATLIDTPPTMENPPYEQSHTDWKYKFSFYLVLKVMDEVQFVSNQGRESRLELVKYF